MKTLIVSPMAIANNIALTPPSLRRKRKMSLKVQWAVIIPVEIGLLALIVMGCV